MLLKIEKAKEIIFEKSLPLDVITIDLNEAEGLCIAEEIFADRDFPPTNRSAMDGFAVRAEDILTCPKKLKLIGETSAGSSSNPFVESNTCARILTGAVVPPGANTVIKVEDTEEDVEKVTIFESAELGLNIRKQGEEIRKGKKLICKRKNLNSSQIGVCASVGKQRIKVYKKPKISIITTGKELFSETSDYQIKDYQIRDSNGPSLRSALKKSGFNCSELDTSPDNLDILKSKIKNLIANNDVLILCGGVSVGKYDFVPEAIKSLGAKIQVHGILMKPGKPFLYGTFGENKHIFGLPGNPLSVLAGFHELVLPSLLKMSGFLKKDYCKPFFFPVSCDVNSKNYRTEFLLGQLVFLEKETIVKPLKSCGSGDLISSLEADGVFAVPTKTKIKKGEKVKFTFWN